MTSNQKIAKQLATMQRERIALAENVEAAIPGLRFNRRGENPDMGGACPWQAEGTYNGKEFYARFRGNRGAMTVYEGEAWESPAILSSVFVGWVDTGRDDDWYAGSIDGAEETIAFMKRLIAGLEPVSEANPTFSTILSGEIDALVQAVNDGKITFSNKNSG